MDRALDKYIEKQAIYPELIKQQAPSGLKTVIIIPAFNEPEILKTLESILYGSPAKYDAEVLIAFNYSEACSQRIKTENIEIAEKVQNWAAKHYTKKLRFYPLIIKDVPQKHAGAGMARKIAMDEAVRRFISAQNPDGTIVSLDADTLVSKKYLTDIEKWFGKHKKANAATFYFEHRIEPDKFGKDATSAIIKYELYLRYFKQLLEFTNFPYAIHTIGSAFAVKASTYCKQGGMNRKQGGEDFYFLHKVFPLGNCSELNNIRVFPSARPSERVPFGTGPAINNIIKEGELMTYQIAPFIHIKELFACKNELFKANSILIHTIYNDLNSSFKNYLQEKEFVKKIDEINSNCSTPESFEKRFFAWFNAFQIIKYVNQFHLKNTKIPIKEAALVFAKQYLCFQESASSEDELLDFYRKLEKNS